MNDLEKYFYGNTGRVIHKWRHYFEVYERHFSRFRGTAVTVVEIGVYKGGSLQMWKNYFGPQAKIYGIDINPRCKAYEEEQIEVVIGRQEDRNFLQSFAESVPQIDIVIDDGGHTMQQQITSYEALFPHIDANGVYLCEDLHTSYWAEFGGGYKNPASFIEYAKNFVDYLNGWHARPAPPTAPQLELAVTDFTRSVHSVHFYSSVVVVEKRPTNTPSDMMTGVE